MAICGLIAAAKLNDLDLQGYVGCTLERIADHPVNRADELLPWDAAGRRRREIASSGSLAERHRCVNTVHGRLLSAG